MMSSVNGMTSARRFFARSRYSNCPDHAHRVASGQLHLLAHRALRIIHHRLQVAPAHVDINPAGQPCILAFQHGRAVDDGELRQGAQRDLRAALGDDGQAAQFFQRVAQFARVAHADWKAL